MSDETTAAPETVAISVGAAAAAEMVAHRHVWRFDGTDGPYYVYHCDAHDPPVVRRIWSTEADHE